MFSKVSMHSILWRYFYISYALSFKLNLALWYISFIQNFHLDSSQTTLKLRISVDKTTVVNVGILIPAQNGWNVTDDIFKHISWKKVCVFWFKFHWGLFPKDELTISRHWFRQWPGAKQVTSHCLMQCWSGLMALCPSRPYGIIRYRWFETSRAEHVDI